MNSFIVFEFIKGYHLEEFSALMRSVHKKLDNGIAKGEFVKYDVGH